MLEVGETERAAPIHDARSRGVMCEPGARVVVTAQRNVGHLVRCCVAGVSDIERHYIQTCRVRDECRGRAVKPLDFADVECPEELVGGARERGVVGRIHATLIGKHETVKDVFIPEARMLGLLRE